MSTASDEADALAKIELMVEPDRAIAERIHAIVTSTDPELAPRLWYGQPAYARQGKVLCFVRSGHDDGEPYVSFGFTPEANLDDGSGIWPTSYAVTALSDAAEETITELVRKAVS